MNDHLSPVGNPAPPRPRSPEFFTSSTTAPGASARLVREAHGYRYFFTSSGTFSGVTLSMKSSLTSTGVAKPHAPRHSTSITVQRPSGLVAPSSFAPVASSSAFTTASAPQILHGDVVHTWTKYFPTGCV